MEAVLWQSKEWIMLHYIDPQQVVLQVRVHVRHRVQQGYRFLVKEQHELRSCSWKHGSSNLVKFFLNARKRWQYTDPKDEYNFKRKKMEKDYAEMCIISICLLESTTFNCLYKFQVLRITVTYKNICPTGLWMFHFTQITVNVISF